MRKHAALSKKCLGFFSAFRETISQSVSKRKVVKFWSKMTTSGRLYSGDHWWSKKGVFNQKWSNKGRFRPQVVKIGSNSTTSGQPKNATKSGKSKPHKDHIGFSNYGSVWGVLRPCFLGQLPHQSVLGLYAGSKSSHQTSAWRVLKPTASVPGAAPGRAICLVGRWIRGLQLLDFWMSVALDLQGRQAFAGRVCGS